MFQYELIRSKRKTISLSVTSALKVVVRAPIRMAQKDIDAFVKKHEDWVQKNLLETKHRNEFKQNNSLKEEQVLLLKEQAKRYIPKRVEFYSNIMNVRANGVKITSAKTRWGSCSGKNSLCFPYRIMLLPEDIIDYIVVHELSHIIEKNHSASFYRVVQRYLPDYKIRVQKLKEIQSRIPN